MTLFKWKGSNGKVGSFYTPIDAQKDFCISDMNADLEFRLVVLNDDMKIAFKKVADQIASKEKIANIDDCTTEAQRINAELDAITDYDPPIAFPHREVTASRIAVGLRPQDDDDA